MDIMETEGQLNINLKKEKKSFSSILPFKKVGENDQHNGEIGTLGCQVSLRGGAIEDTHQRYGTP